MTREEFDKLLKTRPISPSGGDGPEMKIVIQAFVELAFPSLSEDSHIRLADIFIENLWTAYNK